MKWTFAWLKEDILLISSYGANSHQKEKKLWSTSAKATSSSMLRHLVSGLNNPASIRIQAHLNVLLISAPLNYIEEGWEGSDCDCYACYCRMIRSRNVAGVALLFGSKLWKPRLARRFHAII